MYNKCNSFTLWQVVMKSMVPSYLCAMFHNKEYMKPTLNFDTVIPYCKLVTVFEVVNSSRYMTN